MTGNFIIATLKNHEPIEGADKIVSTSLFGETLIVDKESNPIGTRGIVIDCLSVIDSDLCHHLNMYRHANLNKDKTKSGYIEDNGRVRAIKLRGVKCSGLFLSFKQLGQHPKLSLTTLEKLKDGVQDNSIADVPICKQFYRKVKSGNLGGKQGKSRENLVPTFKEHFDTDQLARNLDKVKLGDFCVITEKQHGTSLRCGRLPVIKKSKWDVILNKFGIKTKQKTEYDFVVGSRRVTKSVGNEAHGDKEHFYDTDVWSYVAHRHFEEKLHKGETVYAEIVGYLPDGGLIMPSSGNKKLKPFLEKDEYKEFINQYGDDTVFTYGCEPKHHKVFVYRITMTNEDGHSVDYSWDAVKARCEEMNIPTVPELARVHLVNPHPELRNVFDYQGQVQKLATELAEAPSTQFPTHLREGVCVRIDRGTTPIIMKEKAYNFKVLEGIIKESQDTIEDEA